MSSPVAQVPALPQSLLTAPVLFVTLALSAGGPVAAVEYSLRGWRAAAWVPVASQALGGIVVGALTKRLGGCAKAFGIMGGLVLTGVLQSALDRRMLRPEVRGTGVDSPRPTRR